MRSGQEDGQYYDRIFDGWRRTNDGTERKIEVREERDAGRQTAGNEEKDSQRGLVLLGKKHLRLPTRTYCAISLQLSLSLTIYHLSLSHTHMDS